MRVVSLLLIVLSFSLISFVFAADVPPSQPIRAEIGYGVLPAALNQDWGLGLSESLNQLSQALKDRCKWAEIAGTAGDIRIEVIGRNAVIGGYKKTNVYALWVALVYREEKYSLIGIDNSQYSGYIGAAYSAASLINDWVKTNYDRIRSKAYIPGGAKTADFPLSLAGSYKKELLAPVTKMKLYAGPGETPPGYSSDWGKNKEDTIKDLLESLRKKSDWFDLVNSKDEAELTVQILGRKSTLNQFTIWTSVSCCGEQEVTLVARSNETWRKAAEDLQSKLEILAGELSKDPGPNKVTVAPLSTPKIDASKLFNPVQANLPDQPAPKHSASAPGVDAAPKAAAEAPHADKSAAPPAATKAVTNQDVIKLVKAGLNEANTIAFIRKSNAIQFDFSADQLKLLLQNGVTNNIIAAMRERSERP